MDWATRLCQSCLGGLWVAVVGFGRIGEEGSVDVQLFPVLGGPFTGNSECQLKRGSEMGHPSIWELF
jgi:expansin (peptidoglycan-binding protein)